MRVLIVSQYFLPQPLANAEVVGGLAGALAERGHDVHVVTPARGEGPAGVTVHRALGYFPTDRASIAKRVAEYLAFTAGAVVTGLRVPKPDVILVPSPPPTLGLVGTLLSAVRRAPYVYVVQDLYPEVAAVAGAVGGSLPMRVLKTVMSFVYRRAGAVVVIDRTFVETVGGAAGTTPVIPVRNAIDRRVFRHAPADTRYLDEIGVPQGATVVMYAGNVGRSQDLASVARATAATGACFVVHGEGAGLAALQAAVRAEGWQHVRFSPYRSREELGGIYASADVHIVPLRPGVANASVPSKLLSIFSAGRPAIVTAEPRSAAAGVVAEAGGGWVVPPGDGEALRTALETALADRAELDRRGRAAFLWSETGASLERCAAEYEAVLEQASQR